MHGHMNVKYMLIGKTWQQKFSSPWVFYHLRNNPTKLYYCLFYKKYYLASYARKISKLEIKEISVFVLPEFVFVLIENEFLYYIISQLTFGLLNG
jgi:hypothetical protein